MERGGPTQLDLPISAPAEPCPERRLERLSRDELQQLRERLPPTIQFGTRGWVYPGWEGIVWSEARSKEELELSGLSEYATHPLLTTMYLEPGSDASASERDLRRYAGQLPAEVHCVLQVHQEVTSPRFLHADELARDSSRGGQANPHFLDSRFFINEILSTYKDVFGERLGPFLFSFPPTLARSGIHPDAFVERLTRFLAALPRDTPVAVELREATYMTLPYARLLARFDVSHVFTTWAGMPPLDEQARQVPTCPEYILQIADPTGGGAARRRALEPFDKLVDPDPIMRRKVVDLLLAIRGVPTYVLVHNEAEGCAPLTIAALAEMAVQRLAKR